MAMKVIRLEETPSTNTWIREHRAGLAEECLAFAVSQTAGRGQRGNSWESEPGKNLTASALLFPSGVEPARQFMISEAVSLAVVDFLEAIGIRAMVKWPNDIYVADSKICGILIEHSVMPREILYTIAGVGINLNQRCFLSDAPNPVSVWQLTGQECDVEQAAHALAMCISRRMAMTQSAASLHEEYMGRLWRGDGRMYPFFDRITGKKITARIAGVAPDGTLTLLTDAGESRSYAFKEIEFIL